MSEADTIQLEIELEHDELTSVQINKRDKDWAL
ncbi:hypothetical protein LSPH24S_10023 [Lysinibacillus sphaericus]